MSSIMTIALYAEFTATPGNIEQVRGLIDSYAQTVRAEPGNICFDAHTVESQPAKVFVYELYCDAAAFESHLAAPAGAEFNRQLADLVEGGGSNLTMLNPISVAV
jgi:quinol monooxygenase YgiN